MEKHEHIQILGMLFRWLHRRSGALQSLAWNILGKVDTPQPTVWPYKVAMAMYKEMSVEQLVNAFELDDSFLSSTTPLIIHFKTGWDVLRPADCQSSNEPFTYEIAKKLSLKALKEVHKQKLSKSAQTRKSKLDLINEIFTEEARECDDDIANHKKQKRRLTLSHLSARKEEVCKDDESD